MSPLPLFDHSARRRLEGNRHRLSRACRSRILAWFGTCAVVATGMTAALTAIPSVGSGYSQAPAGKAGNPPAPTEGGSGSLGDLLVAPTRLVFEGRQRSAEITLVNTGTQPATYRISFTRMRMNENGDFQEVDTPAPGEQFAEDLIRFSPRQVMLEPNVAQAVRMQLRKPPDLPSGEYRSHLLFRAVPSTTGEGTSRETSGIQIKLTPIYGISIPLIVRHGETSATVTLTDLQFTAALSATDPSILRLKINRSGNQSVHGNLTVSFVGGDGRSHVVAIIKGIAVYTPNPFRNVQIPLRAAPGIKIERGRLHVTYVQGKPNGELLAESNLKLP